MKNNKQSQSKKETETVVSVKNVSKIFKIPHKKVDTLRSVFVNMGKGISNYEKFNALKDVSFEVKKGEFFGIIGKNGSGKSTLLKILAGVYAQDKGAVEINGLISPFLELGIGFNPELSGRDNIYLNATVLGLTEKEIDAKFDDIVRFAELEKFIDQQLKNYSSGMSVRLAFSVSIHANRDILLMDEVLAVGDANFQKKCIKIFESYSDTNRTVILVTHDIAAVRKYCDRAMLLHNGKMLKVGDVDEVCDEYVLKNMSAEAQAELEEAEKMKEGEKKREKEMKKSAGEKQKENEFKNRDNRDKTLTGVLIINEIISKNELGRIEIEFEAKCETYFNKYYDCGIVIADKNGNRFFACNTMQDNLMINGDAKISLEITGIKFNEKEYKIIIAIFDRESDQLYDIIKNKLIIKQIDQIKFDNTVLKHLWKIRKKI